MLVWAAILLAAYGFYEIFQAYYRDKVKREQKQRYITRRLKELGEQDEQDVDNKGKSNDNSGKG